MCAVRRGKKEVPIHARSAVFASLKKFFSAFTAIFQKSRRANLAKTVAVFARKTQDVVCKNLHTVYILILSNCVLCTNEVPEIMFVPVDSTDGAAPHFSTKTRRFRTGLRVPARFPAQSLSHAKNHEYTMIIFNSNKTEHAFIQPPECGPGECKKCLKLSKKVCVQGLTSEKQSVIMRGQRWKANPSDGSERKRKHPVPVIEARGMHRLCAVQNV